MPPSRNRNRSASLDGTLSKRGHNRKRSQDTSHNTNNQPTSPPRLSPPKKRLDILSHQQHHGGNMAGGGGIGAESSNGPTAPRRRSRSQSSSGAPGAPVVNGFHPIGGAGGRQHQVPHGMNGIGSSSGNVFGLNGIDPSSFFTSPGAFGGQIGGQQSKERNGTEGNTNRRQSSNKETGAHSQGKRPSLPSISQSGPAPGGVGSQTTPPHLHFVHAPLPTHLAPHLPLLYETCGIDVSEASSSSSTGTAPQQGAGSRAPRHNNHNNSNNHHGSSQQHHAPQVWTRAASQPPSLNLNHHHPNNHNHNHNHQHPGNIFASYTTHAGFPTGGYWTINPSYAPPPVPSPSAASSMTLDLENLSLSGASSSSSLSSSPSSAPKALSMGGRAPSHGRHKDKYHHPKSAAAHFYPSRDDLATTSPSFHNQHQFSPNGLHNFHQVVFSDSIPHTPIKDDPFLSYNIDIQRDQGQFINAMRIYENSWAWPLPDPNNSSFASTAFSQGGEGRTPQPHSGAHTPTAEITGLLLHGEEATIVAGDSPYVNVPPSRPQPEHPPAESEPSSRSSDQEQRRSIDSDIRTSLMDLDLESSDLSSPHVVSSRLPSYRMPAPIVPVSVPSSFASSPSSSSATSPSSPIPHTHPYTHHAQSHSFLPNGIPTTMYSSNESLGTVVGTLDR